LEHGSICSYHQNKHFENVEKFQMKFLHLRLDILCVHTKLRKKTTIFVAYGKGQNKCHVKTFLTPKFVFLTHEIKNNGFWNVQQLVSHGVCAELWLLFSVWSCHVCPLRWRLLLTTSSLRATTHAGHGRIKNLTRIIRFI
jgi:hypothetical protein